MCIVSSGLCFCDRLRRLCWLRGCRLHVLVHRFRRLQQTGIVLPQVTRNPEVGSQGPGRFSRRSVGSRPSPAPSSAIHRSTSPSHGLKVVISSPNSMSASQAINKKPKGKGASVLSLSLFSTNNCRPRSSTQDIYPYIPLPRMMRHDRAQMQGSLGNAATQPGTLLSEYIVMWREGEGTGVHTAS